MRKLSIVGAFGIVLILPWPALAQSAYDSGLRDGYLDHLPPSGYPDSLSDYGRGFRAGQDQADDDDDIRRKDFDSFESRMNKLRFGADDE